MRQILLFILLTTILGSSGVYADGVECLTEQMVGYIDTTGEARGVAVQGDYAFIADGESGEVHIIDVSDPANPTPVSTYTSPGAAEQIAVYGNVLAIANEQLRLEFIDISDADNPTLILNTMSQRRFKDIETRDGFLYTTGYSNSHFNIWDIRDPASIVFTGSVPNVRFGNQIAFNDQTAYLADGGLKIVDISNPKSLETISDFELEDYSILSIGVFESVSQRKYAIIANHDFLGVIDVTEPESHDIVFIQDDWIGFNPEQIVIRGTTAYLGFDYPGIIQVLDLSDPTSPAIIAEHQTRGPALDFEIDDQGLIYIAAGAGGMQIIDSSNHPSNSTLSEFELKGRFDRIFDLIEEDGILYMAGGREGLVIVDTSDVRNPVRLSSISTSSRSISIAKYNDFIYLGTADSGIRIVDVQDPNAPIEVGTLPTPGDNYDLLITDDHLLAINHIRALETYSLSNPAEPELTGSLSDFQGSSLSLHDDLLFSGFRSFTKGVYIYDASDLNEIQYLSNIRPDLSMSSVAANSDYMYSSSAEIFSPETNGIYVFNIQDSHNPIEIGFIPLDATYQLQIVDDKLYACANEDGLRIYDISDGAKPELIGWHSPFFGQAHAVHTDGYVAYVANGTNDASIVDLRSCGECVADLNLDRLIDFIDVSIFLESYFSKTPISNLNGDATWNFFDVATFIQAYNTGCD